MLNRSLKVEHLLALSLAATSFLWVGTSTKAQSTPAQDNRDNRPVQDDDTSRRELAQFRQFLDSHPEIAEQLRKDPSLADNQQFLKTHAALQTFLQQQSGIREEIKENPNAFMRQEEAFNRGDDGFDRDATVGRERDEFNRFLGGHREIADQLRRDPSLANKEEFLRTHPEFQAYLQEQPGIRDELRQNPNAFMRQEDTYNRGLNMRDHDPMHDHIADFGGFLNSHSDIQKDLSRNPANLKDHDYVQNHAQLDAYLNAHPDARAEMMANPQSFVHGALQYNANPSSTSSGAGVMTGRGTGTTSADTGTTGTGTAGSATVTSTNPTTTREPAKPNY
jgi:hypothetical protein